jgi:hypothetical protein
MNQILRTAFAVTLAAVSLPVFAAADAPGTPAPAAPGPGRKEIQIRRVEHRAAETESVTFLGVETGPVSPTLVAQLGLTEGAGLVVLHVVPDSAAAAALKDHDILLKLDDQILIDQHQLSVLIRNHQEGDEVTLTYVRAGKQATARVKLTRHDVPKATPGFRLWNHLTPGPDGNVFGLSGRMTLPEAREDTDEVLSMMQRAHRGEPVTVRIERKEGAAPRAMSLHPGISNFVYSDDDGTLELKVQGGEKTLTAKNAKGEQEFSGPVGTPEQRKALPEKLRERLEKLEGMQNVTFHTDGDFEGAEAKVLRPSGDTIMFRRERAAPAGTSEAY